MTEAALSGTYETVKVDKDGHGVTTITLNRPHKKNAMNPTMHFEMSALLGDLKYDDETRVLVIKGAGDSFCAGMDLNEFFMELDGKGAVQRRARDAGEWRSHQLRLFPRPTIAAVHGNCFGGAFTTVSSCDIVVTAEDARYGLSEVNFGKIAGGYVSWEISQIMNPRDTMYYTLTGETFDGVKAVEMHLATMAVPHADLNSTVEQIAAGLAAKNPIVVEASKEALMQSRHMSYEQAGPWLNRAARSLDCESKGTWRDGVEQFTSGKFKPGLGAYTWEKDS